MSFQDILQHEKDTFIKFYYNSKVSSFSEIYEYLIDSRDDEFSFLNRGREIEVYEEKSFVGKILDGGVYYLVSKKVLANPGLSMMIRRMRV